MKNDHDVPVFMLMHQIVHLGKYRAMKEMTSFELKPNQVGFYLYWNVKASCLRRSLHLRLE